MSTQHSDNSRPEPCGRCDDDGQHNINTDRPGQMPELEWCDCAFGQWQRRADIERLKSRAEYSADFPARFRTTKLRTSPLLRLYPDLANSLQKVGDGDWTADTASFYFWGPYGCGKTGIAIPYARQFFCWAEPDEYPGDVFFIEAARYLDVLKASYSDSDIGKETFRKIGRADLLVLDDLGAEYITDSGWAEEKLFDLINRRHGAMRPIVVTSNLNPEALAQRIGERTVSRLIEMCDRGRNVFHLDGPDLRLIPPTDTDDRVINFDPARAHTSREA